MFARTVMVSLLCLLPVLAAAQTGAHRVQCWTDRNGQRACGDRVPPEYAKQERQVFDAQGRVVETRSRQKTPEEIAAEEEARARAEKLKVDEEKAREYDRFLLSTFEHVSDLERARDERLQVLEGREALIRKSIDDNDRAIEQQKRRIEAIGKNGKPTDKFQAQLKELESTRAVNRRLLESVRQEQVDMKSKYASDIDRLRTLKAARK